MRISAEAFNTREFFTANRCRLYDTSRPSSGHVWWHLHLRYQSCWPFHRAQSRVAVFAAIAIAVEYLGLLAVRGYFFTEAQYRQEVYCQLIG